MKERLEKFVTKYQKPIATAVLFIMLGMVGMSLGAMNQLIITGDRVIQHTANIIFFDQVGK